MSVRILIGDVRDRLKELPDASVHCCVTSPPYFGLRDYGVAGQIGLEPTPEAFVAELVGVFKEVRRVLRNDGTLWLNLGDSYAANGARSNNNGTGATTMGWPGQDPDTLNKAVGIKLPAVNHGLKPKDLIGIPWRVAFALQADGWYLRQDIIWSKPNPMPESVQDRCTKAHEYIFMLSKSPRYYYDIEAIKEPASWDASKTKFPDGWDTGEGGHGTIHRQGREKGKRNDATDKQRGHSRRHAGFNDRWDAMEKAEQCSGMRNKRSVWEIATQPFSEAHFATFPPALIEPCIKAGCPSGGLVLDPFGGAGTTGLVADRLGRDAILIELNPEYAAIAERRITDEQGMFRNLEVVAA